MSDRVQRRYSKEPESSGSEGSGRQSERKQEKRANWPSPSGAPVTLKSLGLCQLKPPCLELASVSTSNGRWRGLVVDRQEGKPRRVQSPAECWGLVQPGLARTETLANSVCGLASALAVLDCER